MANVRVTLDDAAAQAMFHRLVALLQRPRAPITQAGQVLQRLVRDRFADQSDPWGRRWAPWAESTRRQRARQTSNTGILTRTFALFRSIDYRVTADDSVEVFTRGIDYASYHQFGVPNRRLPQRAFFPLRSEGVADIPARWWAEILAPVEAAIEREARA